MASALFTIDGNALSAGIVTVSASASVALAVVDTTGVSSIEWSCVGTHSSSVATSTITAAITPAGSPAGATATLAMPAGAGQSYLIRCLVRDGQGLVAEYKQGQVAVLNNNSILPLAFGETFERNITHGWIDPINAFLNTAPGGALLTTGGTMSGDIAMGGNDITGIDTLASAAATDLSLDAPTGQSVLSTINSVTVVDVTAAGAAVTGALSATTSVTGATIVGNISATTPLLTGPAASDLSLNAVTGQSVLATVNGVTELEIDATTIDAQSNAVTTTGAVTGGSLVGTTHAAAGSSPADAGTFRGPNTTTALTLRDNAGTGNVTAVGISTSDVIEVGIGGAVEISASGSETTLAGKVVFGGFSDLTIASGVVTVTSSLHGIDTEASASTDDLNTINGGTLGQLLVVKATSGARTVVMKDGTGNLALAGDFSLDNVDDIMTLIYIGTEWREISRSNNGA